MSMESTTVALGGKPAAFTRDWRTPLELLLLGAIWGGSFLFMRVAAKPSAPSPWSISAWLWAHW